MYKNNDFIYEAAARLEALAGVIADVDSGRKEYDALLNINEIQFLVEAKSQIRNSNKGMIIEQVLQIKNNSSRPLIVIAKYISQSAAEELKEKGINYIDSAGNAFIKEGNFFLYVSGQKSNSSSNTNKSRAFQEAGIKVLFNVLAHPENLQLSYRELAAITGISIGSVSNIMKELEELNFVLKTSTKRILKNKQDLLERWLIAYADTLKPRLLKKRMRLRNENWKDLPMDDLNYVCLWGGEPAAAIKTGHLSPEKFSIYTNASWQELIPKLDLVPDEAGNVEVNQVFWQEKDKGDNIVPALLIYADLVTSGYGRNIEIANEILANELPDFK